jgi:regulator of replication initiation timing
MITKGYLLNVSNDERVKSVLAVSENLQELEDKIEELKKADEDKKKRYTAISNLQNEYFKKCHDNYKNKEAFEDCYYRLSSYEIKDFVTKNPVPDEIKEFVIYSEDRGSGSLYFYSDRDFNTKYWITNILGFK